MFKIASVEDFKVNEYLFLKHPVILRKINDQTLKMLPVLW